MTNSERTMKSRKKNPEKYREINRRLKALKRGTNPGEIAVRKIQRLDYDCIDMLEHTGYRDGRINNGKGEGDE